MKARDKILSRQKLRPVLARAQARGKRIVFTNGCFDLLHVGHLRSFEQARSHGDVLVVGVNRDRRVRELKGPARPIIPEAQRAEMVAGFGVVDYVVLFSEDTPSALIRALRPDVICKGSEYRGQPTEERRTIEALGGRCVFLRQTPGVRTSRILAKLA